METDYFIMGILKTLTDEYFEKVIRGENRIEFNTKDLKPVDMGGTVFWADKNLMSKGGNTPFEEHFSFKELYEYKFKFGDGWRLPTWKECRELFKKDVTREVISDWRTKLSGIIKFRYKTTNEKLRFDEVGFYLSADSERESKRTYGSAPVFTMWTSDMYNDESFIKKTGYALVYTFDPGKNTTKREYFSHWEQFYPVRLVKSKK